MFTPFTAVYSGQKSGVNVGIAIKINYLLSMFTPFTPYFIIRLKKYSIELMCYNYNRFYVCSS